MARTLLVATFLLGITCVLAANTTNSSMPIPSPAATSMSPSMPPSSSSSSPTPSPSPSPYPPTWKVREQNKTCILMKARVTVKTKFLVNETTMEEQTVSFNVTKDANVSTDVQHLSSCGPDSSSLALEWKTNTSDPDAVPYYLTFHFQSNSTLETWELNEVAVSFKVDGNPVFANYINQTAFPTIDGVLKSQLASAMMNQSYLCDASSSNPLAVATNDTFNVTVDISDMTVQAFHFTNDTKFDTSKDCKADTPGKGKSGGNNKVVPIAVGAALAGLVVIVLVAYLIGRFRSRKSSSYEPLS